MSSDGQLPPSGGNVLPQLHLLTASWFFSLPICQLIDCGLISSCEIAWLPYALVFLKMSEFLLGEDSVHCSHL